LEPIQKILNGEFLRMKISIDLDSLQTYPTSRNLFSIYRGAETSMFVHIDVFSKNIDGFHNCIIKYNFKNIDGICIKTKNKQLIYSGNMLRNKNKEIKT